MTELLTRTPIVTLLVLCVRCGTLNSNQSEECECIMEFSLIHFNVLILGLSAYDSRKRVQVVISLFILAQTFLLRKYIGELLFLLNMCNSVTNTHHLNIAWIKIGFETEPKTYHRTSVLLPDIRLFGNHESHCLTNR